MVRLLNVFIAYMKKQIAVFGVESSLILLKLSFYSPFILWTLNFVFLNSNAKALKTQPVTVVHSKTPPVTVVYSSHPQHINTPEAMYSHYSHPQLWELQYCCCCRYNWHAVIARCCCICKSQLNIRHYPHPRHHHHHR